MKFFKYSKISDLKLSLNLWNKILSKISLKDHIPLEQYIIEVTAKPTFAIEWDQLHKLPSWSNNLMRISNTLKYQFTQLASQIYLYLKFKHTRLLFQIA